MGLRDDLPLHVDPGTQAPQENGEPPADRLRTRRLAEHVERLEYVVMWFLIAMMGIVIVLAVIDLAWVLLDDFLSPPLALLDIGELLELFGLFLLVLIGIELLETLKAYVRERLIRAEVVILVAVIALARKIITLDVSEESSASLGAIAAMLVALGLTYFLIRRTHDADEARSPEGL